MTTVDNIPKMRHFDFSTDEFHHYPVDIPQNCLDVIDKNTALVTIMCLPKLAMYRKRPFFSLLNTLTLPRPLPYSLVVAEVVVTSGWGRNKDEDDLSWAHRCAMMANRLCRPRKKQGYGR